MRSSNTHWWDLTPRVIFNAINLTRSQTLEASILIGCQPSDCVYFALMVVKCVIGSSLGHHLACNQHWSVLIENKSVFTKVVYQGQVSSNYKQSTWCSDQTSWSVGNGKLVRQEYTGLDLVKNLNVVDEFSPSLNRKESRDNMWIEKVLHSKISLKVLIVIVVKAFLQAFWVTRLSKREILVVRELTKVFANYVFKIVEHRRDWLYFVWVNLFAILFNCSACAFF